MKIQQNMDVQNNIIKDQADVNSASKSTRKNKNSAVVSGAALKENNPLSQRQSLAKRKALKVVSDAFSGEKKLDAQMQGIKDEIKRLQDVINEKSADTRSNDAKIKELQEEYGIDPESLENKALNQLAFRMRSPDNQPTDEELSKLSEYQQKALYYVTANQQNSLDIDHAKAMQMGNVQGYADMKSERAKSQDMLKAQDAAEDIMEASNADTIAQLTQDVVDHVDEKQKEREEEAKKAAEEKKEEKKEKAERLEKEAMQQEMIENIKERAADVSSGADIKRAMARRERAEADSIGAENAQKTIISDAGSIEDTQNAVNTEITNILNKLSLLSNDVKGSTVDTQI